MEKLIFVKGQYHSQFMIFDQATFLESFCLNMDIAPEDVTFYEPLTEEQLEQVRAEEKKPHHNLTYEDGKAIVRAPVLGNVLEITLTPA